jgi:hypothetical protein
LAFSLLFLAFAFTAAALSLDGRASGDTGLDPRPIYPVTSLGIGTNSPVTLRSHGLYYFEMNADAGGVASWSPWRQTPAAVVAANSRGAPTFLSAFRVPSLPTPNSRI